MSGWKRFLLALIAFPLVCIAWRVLDGVLPYPGLADGGIDPTNASLRWLGLPLLLTMVPFGVKWTMDMRAHHVRERARRQAAQWIEAQEVAAHTDGARREYALEVLGLGVTFDKYRQAKLWDALQKGHGSASIREPDPKKYPWSEQGKAGNSGTRACDALENGAERSPMYWGVPTLYAGPQIHDPESQPSAIQPIAGLAASADGTGMAWHLFATGPWQLSERPDGLLEQAFDLFDAYPDLPYLVLLSNDDMALRDSLQPIGVPMRVKDGYAIPERPDATAVFVLARRERVEPLRPYVWDDPDNDYLQSNLRMMYCQLERDVPTPTKLNHPEQLNPGRQPTIAEWLHAAAVFARSRAYDDPENRDVGLLPVPFRRWLHHPPRDWTPTPWFPIPWNKEQMATFDRLPSLGFVHRPVFVRFEDAHGQPLTRRDERRTLLDAGWQQALATLPEAERREGPARIVAAFDHDVDRLVALQAVLRRYAAQGGPDIDTGTPGRFINTDKRLGNTGAATFFMQMALGVMGSTIEGGVSAAVNLRDPAGASIVFISPPDEARRAAQGGRDVFRNHVGPSIDPDDYKPPTVGQVVGGGTAMPGPGAASP